LLKKSKDKIIEQITGLNAQYSSACNKKHIPIKSQLSCWIKEW